MTNVETFIVILAAYSFVLPLTFPLYLKWGLSEKGKALANNHTGIAFLAYAILLAVPFLVIPPLGFLWAVALGYVLR